MNEAKLILVGQGGVGKSSLVEALTTGKFEPGKKPTEGIKISDWPCALALSIAHNSGLSETAQDRDPAQFHRVPPGRDCLFRSITQDSGARRAEERRVERLHPGLLSRVPTALAASGRRQLAHYLASRVLQHRGAPRLRS